MHNNNAIANYNKTNVITFPQVKKKKKKKTSVENNLAFLGAKPMGVFPKGTVPSRTIIVDMAVGMYQFHDLLANHANPVTGRTLTNTYVDINDNNSIFGFLNM